MITDQPVNNDDDMHKVTDNILRDAGMTIQEFKPRKVLYIPSQA